jgi:hypothetical protein
VLRQARPTPREPVVASEILKGNPQDEILEEDEILKKNPARKTLNAYFRFLRAA